MTESKLRMQVRAFHEAFSVPVLTRPQVPSDDRVRLRLRLVAEEFFELLEACTDEYDRAREEIDEARELVTRTIEDAPIAVDLVGVADALADIQVVCCGSEIEFGIDGDKTMDEVMASNLSKIGSTIREDGKILKDAPGYFAPNLERVLREQGWENDNAI